jgi:hypothetical protein
VLLIEDQHRSAQHRIVAVAEQLHLPAGGADAHADDIRLQRRGLLEGAPFVIVE